MSAGHRECTAVLLPDATLPNTSGFSIRRIRPRAPELYRPAVLVSAFICELLYYTLVHKPVVSILCLALLRCVATAAQLIGADGAATNEVEHAHAGHAQAVPAKLVQLVRDATKQFVDVNAATAAGYQPFLGCVSGPDHGAMGNHYVNGALVGDGELDASRPEVLIYEASGGGLKLVGVEFVVIADTWLAHHASPPVLEGQSFQFAPSPNRYGLPAHFELHCTSGLGGRTPTGRSWTGITTSPAKVNRSRRYIRSRVARQREVLSGACDGAPSLCTKRKQVGCQNDGPAV
jgi:hypothetical protein